MMCSPVGPPHSVDGARDGGGDDAFAVRGGGVAKVEGDEESAVREEGTDGGEARGAALGGSSSSVSVSGRAIEGGV
jgi:hypothetical protein